MLKGIPGVWNWQIGYGLSYWNNAKILHLLTDVYSKRQEACVHFLQKKDTFKKIRNMHYDLCYVNDIVHSAKTGFIPEAGIVAYQLDNRRIYNEISQFSSRKDVYLFTLNQYSNTTISEFERRGIHINGFINSNDMLADTPAGNFKMVSSGSIQNKRDVMVIIMTRSNNLNKSIRTIISLGFLDFYVIVTDSWYKS